jgi:hypothetical protein
MILLGTMTPTGFSQLLPRRRVNRAMDSTLKQIMEKEAIPWATKVIADEIGKAVEQWLDENGHFLDLDASIQLFAESEMDAQVKTRIDSLSDRASREWLKELLDKGSASVFLSETAKFASKLRNQQFSLPVLEKIYLEYENDGGHPLRDNVGKESGFASRQVFMGDFLERKKLPNERRDRRALTCFEKHRPKDPKNKIPLIVHCSFVFNTQRDSEGFAKTLSFDLYLEHLKKVEGAKIAYPWKVKNVQYN